MKIHLTQHLPRGICSLRQPGLAAPGNRSPFNCNIHFQISLASLWQYVSCLVPHGRAGQILLEFSKDGQADNWDEFTYGGLANQPVILSVRTCTFLLMQGVSVLLPVSIQLLRPSWNLWLPSEGSSGCVLARGQKLQLASRQNSGNLGYQSKFSRPRGSYSIFFLLFGRSMAWPRGFVAFFFSWMMVRPVIKVLAVWQPAIGRCWSWI